MFYPFRRYFGEDMAKRCENMSCPLAIKHGLLVNPPFIDNLPMTISIYSWFSSLHIWFLQRANVDLPKTFWYMIYSDLDGTPMGGTTILQEHVPFFWRESLFWRESMCYLLVTSYNCFYPSIEFPENHLFVSMCAIRGWWEQFSPWQVFSPSHFSCLNKKNDFL